MTKNTTGVLVGALVISDAKWKSLPPDVQQHISSELNKSTLSDRDEIRVADERAYAALIKRGYIVDEWNADAMKEYEQMVLTIQNSLTGRMFSAATLQKVKQLAASAK